MDTWAYFRFTSLSILLGFAFFCLSYATSMWRRRNRRGGKEYSRVAVLGQWSRGLFVFGVLLAVVTIIIHEMVPIRGVMQLDESFAARARADAALEHIAPEGPIKEGETLVRFAPRNIQQDKAMLEAKVEKLTAELHKTEAMPLEIDEELTRVHQNAISRLEQAQSALTNYVPLLKETIRIGLEKELEREDKIVALDRLTIDYQATRNQSLSEYDFRFNEFERVDKLSDLEGSVTSSEYELKRLEAIRLAEQIKKLDKSLEQFKREEQQLDENKQQFAQLVQQQAHELNAEIQEYRQEYRQAQNELQVATAAIEKDRQRAEQQRTAELQMVRAEIQEARQEINSLEHAQIVKAPFAGEVVYRSAAPNSIEEHGVVVIMARENSAQIQFSLPSSQVSALEQNSKMDVWLEESSLASCVSGTVERIEPSPVHASHKIVTVGCHPPMDVLPMLADEQLVPIQMTWAPPLLSIPFFQLALSVMLVGGLGSLLSFGRSNSRAVAEESHVENESLGDKESESEKLTEFSDLGLHHGSVGITLQILGNKFRESLFAAEIDRDLLATVEWSLDRHQTRSVKLIRQGFLGTLAVDEDSHQRIDDSLNRLIDEQKIDSEMYDRLISILTTLELFHASPGHSQIPLAE